MISECTSRRAERLRLLLNYAHDHGADRLSLDEEVTGNEAHQAVALANACLAAERDLRERQWEALCTLLALVPPHGGELRDVLHLPSANGRHALLAAHALGWLNQAPQGTDD